MKKIVTYTDYDGTEKREEYDIKMPLSPFGRCLGYSSTPCPKCGRIRLENYESGKQVCEKCSWCPQDGKYVDRNDIYGGGV